MSTTGWVVLAVLVVVALWAISVYNRLRKLKNTTANAFGQIDVQLKRRHDLIPNLVETARGYLAHEAKTLEAVTMARNQAVGAAGAARAAPTSATAIGALAVAEQSLGGSLGRLFAVAESYPDLKADKTMASLSEELTSTENRIGFARQAYNDQVLDYNNAATGFPAVVVARLAGFTPGAMLESTASEEERKAPRVAF